MATLEEINAGLKRTNIKGKPYIEVNQRVLAFWENFPEGSIQTELVSFDDRECVFKANVYNMGVLVSTGHAWEMRDSSQINRSSFLENCETSAIGRALGILGIGSTESIASADEVRHAQDIQSRSEPKKDNRAALTEELKSLKYEAVSLGIKPEAMAEGISTICKGFKVDEKGGWVTKTMTDQELKAAVERIKQRIADKKSLMEE